MQIPLLRETVAQLVYKVKGALAANKCSSAFWMGNLKNRDIYGEEILSQTTSITGSSLTADDEDGGDGNGDEDNELLENSNDNERRGLSGTRRSKRQSNRGSTSKGKKRKLYRSKNDTDDGSNDNNDEGDSSRSRCF